MKERESDESKRANSSFTIIHPFVLGSCWRGRRRRVRPGGFNEGLMDHESSETVSEKKFFLCTHEKREEPIVFPTKS